MNLLDSNPRYIELDGEPALLVGSGEHYGALLNADFDYERYFATLASAGLNLTRVFSGTYRERPGHFGIVGNTLAPQAGRFISPWVETSEGKYDLERFNPEWTRRMRDLLRVAGEHGVIVEVVLFCFWYGDDHWRASPMHPANNTGGIGPEDREKVYTVSGNDLLPVQEGLVRTLVAETNEYDNLYFEICNEPYSRHDSTAYLEWQHHMVDVIVETESELPNRHLIAINYQNRALVIPEVHPNVSILNFHYALPEAVRANAHLNRPIADDETGFEGQTADPYRREAWSFMIAGGAIFSHLDYSFTCAHPDGTAPIEGNTPGYGGADLRAQLAFLRRFLEEHEVWKLRPANEIFSQVSNALPGQAMADHGRLYLIYLPENAPGRCVSLWLPSGAYRVSWIHPSRGAVTHEEDIEVKGRLHRLVTPAWASDVAVRLTRK